MLSFVTDVFIVSRSEDELISMQTVLMENVYHVSGALSAMELSMKGGSSPASGNNRGALGNHHQAPVRMTDKIITTL